MGFTKLDSGIVDSSLWSQPECTRVVFTTMLAMKDQNGFVAASRSGLKRRCNLISDPTGEKFDEAIKCLESPDPESRTKAFDGRRIEAIEGGWMVLNHKKYRDFTYSDNPESVRKREYRKEKDGTCPKMSQNVRDISVSASVSVSASEENSKELNPHSKGGFFCKRNEKKVPAEKHGDYVLLTHDEYLRMVEDFGEKFAKCAIAEYDQRYPNSKAVRGHTDHNRGIRDYVSRGFICQGKTPQTVKKEPPKKVVPPEELGPPEGWTPPNLNAIGKKIL